MRNTRDLIHESTYFVDWESKEATLIDHDDEESFYDHLREENNAYCEAEDFREWLNHNYTAFRLWDALHVGNSMDDIWEEYQEYYDEKLYDFFMNTEYFAWL